MCDTLKRFGVSMERELLAQLDRFVLMQGYQSRSHAIRLIVREALLTKLDEKEVVYTSIQMQKSLIDTRFVQIIKRCEYWGVIRSMTTLFNNDQTVTIHLTMELPKENIVPLQMDPLLQPFTTHLKGSNDYETNV